MQNTVENWSKWTIANREAREWVFAAADGGLKIACHCLFELNRRWWTDRSKQDLIYQHKDVLLRHLYKAGYCVEQSAQRQDLECWHTLAYNEGWTDYCVKCDNTGIYRQVWLFHFVFDVGRRYVWHQPMLTTRWLSAEEVPVSGVVQGYKQAIPPGMIADLFCLYLEAIRWYLWGQGVELPEMNRPTLGEAILLDLYDWWEYDLKYRLIDWWHWLAQRFGRAAEPDIYECERRFDDEWV